MKKICFVSGSSPTFLGGISIYQKNLIGYARKNELKFDFTWIYPGIKDRKYSLKGIKYIEVKSFKYPIFKEFNFSKKVKKILTEGEFDIINTHANWGHCLKKYSKKNKQRITHTYHGVTFPYMKIQFEKFGFLRYLFYFTLPFFYFIEKPPIQKADKIICVSEKVKEQIELLYGKRKNIFVIRSGVDLPMFGKISQQKSKKDLKLDQKKIYGLYSGRGGYWNKGLDRAVSLSKAIYEINKNFRLIVTGANKEKCKKYLNLPFIDHRGLIKRSEISKYYSSCDFFFFLSRYEGGAPALAAGEAMASKCFIIFSKDSNQEIIQNKKEGLIIDSFDNKNAGKILKIINNQKILKSIKKNAGKKINKFDLNSWGQKYLEVLLK